MKHGKLAEEVAMLYRAIYARLHARWRKDEQRPSPETIAILSHLELAGPLTVSEAAQHFERAQSAMSELIDRLQAHGYVKRMRDLRDRRRTLVWMTEAGIDILQRSRKVLDLELLEHCIQRMSAPDRVCLMAGLRALAGVADGEKISKRRKS